MFKQLSTGFVEHQSFRSNGFIPVRLNLLPRSRGKSKKRWFFNDYLIDKRIQMQPRLSNAINVEGNSKRNLSTKPQTHLILLVNGILGSENDWKYVVSKLRKSVGDEALVHASQANSSFQTLLGVDSAGKRLSAEVKSLMQQNPSLSKITIVAHSLGGLIARYAVGLLHEPNSPSLQGRGGSLSGLEPVRFITLATPHLGVRGKNQLPFLLGAGVLERMAPSLAPFVVGTTGKQLFLTDNVNPLLVRMTVDCSEAPFLSGLSSFGERVLYANVGYDHMVGWRTSCIRRQEELPKLPHKSLSERYKHVLLESDSPAVARTTKSIEAVSAAVSSAGKKDALRYNVLEEQMVTNLQSVSWRRVDVSFREACFPLFAHHNIHVKLPWLHFEGAGVVNHLTDVITSSMERELHASL